jgi:hypothetical protein
VLATETRPRRCFQAGGRCLCPGSLIPTDRHNASGSRCAHVAHRPVAVFLTIGETLASASAVASAALSASFRWSRRIRANVFLRSVLKLAVYRNVGSRIDFMCDLQNFAGNRSKIRRSAFERHDETRSREPHVNIVAACLVPYKRAARRYTIDMAVSRPGRSVARASSSPLKDRSPMAAPVRHTPHQNH